MANKLTELLSITKSIFHGNIGNYFNIRLNIIKKCTSIESFSLITLKYLHHNIYYFKTFIWVEDGRKQNC